MSRFKKGTTNKFNMYNNIFKVGDKVRFIGSSNLFKNHTFGMTATIYKFVEDKIAILVDRKYIPFMMFNVSEFTRSFVKIKEKVMGLTVEDYMYQFWVITKKNSDKFLIDNKKLEYSTQLPLNNLFRSRQTAREALKRFPKDVRKDHTVIKLSCGIEY